MIAMRIRRIYLTAMLATVPAAAAAMLAAFIASPPNVQLKSDACVDVVGVSACADVDVPNINAVENVVPNVHVPNINVPNVNPGHVGLPGRGR
jgi:hypothetical protein